MKALVWLMALAPVLAHADEELLGVWERTIYWDDNLNVYAQATIRFTFKTDNRFELYQTIFLIPPQETQDDGESEGHVDQDLAIDGDLVVLGSGTYWTVADSLFLEVTEVEETLKGESLATILTHIGKRVARHVCEMIDECPEDYAAYEEAVVAEVIRNFAREFYFEEDSGPVRTYRIEHGKLWIIDTWEDGTVAMTDFDRMGPATAVTSSAWGAVKGGVK